jgi:Skp family chaperone for outer membrane proteins
MEPNENQVEINKLTKDILDKQKKLEELMGKKLIYKKNGTVDYRSLRMDTTNQEKFKEYNREKREKLKKAKMQELEQALDNQIQKTLNTVIERKKKEVVEKEAPSREPTPNRIRPNSF